MDYYLFGYINGNNYGCEEDFEKVGEYLFENGQLVVCFTQDSYVGVKSGDNLNWYMTDGDQGNATSCLFYNTAVIHNGQLLHVPGQMMLTFTIQDNGDDTLTLEYTAEACLHEKHDSDGNCIQCFANVGHQYDNGVCTMCGEPRPIVKPTIALKYPTLSFEDEIRMNVYFSAAPLDDVAEFGLITYSERVDCWDIASAEHVTNGYYLDEKAGLYVTETRGIAAKCLGDVIYFSVYAKLSDGSYLYSELIGYSPSTYAYNLLSSPTSSPSMKSLIVAVLNYGAAAQEYFKYRTDVLVNSYLTDEMQSLVREYEADMMLPIVKADPLCRN